MYHSAKHNKHLDKVRKVVKGAGYSTGGQNHSMKKIAKKAADEAVHKHEENLHDGKMTKLKDGGCASGGKPSPRMDKCSRGGKPKAKGSHVHVNVIVPQGKSNPPMPMPPVAAGGMPPAGAPRPPMPPAPPPAPGGPPMGGAPAMRPPGMKKGGKVGGGFVNATKENVGSDYDAGAGNGIGRMEKENKYGDRFPKKKTGGKVPKDPASRFGYVTEPAEEEGKEIKSKNGRVNVD